MDSFTTNKKIWSDIYKTGKSDLSYPSESLVIYMHHLFRNQATNNVKLLDFGFGSGNNLVHFLKKGFDVYGVEINEYAKKMALNKVANSGLQIEEQRLHLIKENGILPYSSDFFNIVVPWLVLHYNTLDELKRVLASLHRVLQPNGKILTTLIAPSDVGVTNSIPISQHERQMTDSIGNQTNSIITVFEKQEDILEVFNLFRNLEIGYFKTKIKGVVSAHWIISGEK